MTTVSYSALDASPPIARRGRVASQNRGRLPLLGRTR